ncbi:hypothetical protein [uncultured Arthrobacter sp.]|uniref:hypothetical protein n=1 Tax=uncultured Arthrobacter sp. TaxID=114050 RepID=UPI0026141DD6|nr:hypothetical protein [uncultured Arthrobacter sp.]
MNTSIPTRPAAQQASTPSGTFQEWRQAVEAAATVRRQLIGSRVRFAGLLGNGERTGRIADVTASGVKVKLDDGAEAQLLHVDDLVFIR